MPSFALVLVVLAVVCATIAALKEHRKIETMLPMRDGTKLHTLIFLPRGTQFNGKKFPVVMDRSPYGYGDMEWITDIFLPFGFVAVGQGKLLLFIFYIEICL